MFGHCDRCQTRTAGRRCWLCRRPVDPSLLHCWHIRCDGVHSKSSHQSTFRPDADLVDEPLPKEYA